MDSFNEQDFVFEDDFEDKFKKQKRNNIIIVISTVIFLTTFLCLLFIKPNSPKIDNISKENNTETLGIVTSAYKERVKNNNSALKIQTKRFHFKENEIFRFVITRNIKFDGNMSNVDLTFEVPVDIAYRQKIHELNINPAPYKIEQINDKKFAHILLKNPPSNLTLTISGTASVQTYNLKSAEKINKNIDGNLSDYDRQKYLRSEENIQTNSKIIRNAAKNIYISQTDADTVKNIFDYVTVHLKYNIKDSNKVKGAVQALQSGSGVCEEFSDLFTALCRAKGFPARVVSGCDLPLSNLNLNQSNNIGHKWCEVYFDKYGWVVFDPTNNLSSNIYKIINQNNLSTYDILAEVFKYKLYFMVNVQEISINYNSGKGNIISEAPQFKFYKLKN